MEVMFNLIDFGCQYHRLCVLIALTFPANLIDFGSSNDSFRKSISYKDTFVSFEYVSKMRIEDDETCARRDDISAD